MSLETFLTSINPQFSKYVNLLQEQGITEVENISTLQDDDFKYLGIPFFHWRQILSKSKLVTGTPEGHIDNNNDHQSQSNLLSQKLKPKSELESWSCDTVALWLCTYENGNYAKYCEMFKTNNIDGKKLLSMDGVKNLTSIVSDLGARYSIYQGIEKLKVGDVPTVASLLEKEKEIEKKLIKPQKTNSNLLLNENKDGENVSNNEQNTITEKENAAEWTQTNNSDHFKKINKINLHVKSKDESAIRQRLIKFYEIYNPQKLENTDDIDELMHRYQGKEAQLFADLEKKYILNVPKTTYVRKPIDTAFENQTEIILHTFQIYIFNMSKKLKKS